MHVLRLDYQLIPISYLRLSKHFEEFTCELNYYRSCIDRWWLPDCSLKDRHHKSQRDQAWRAQMTVLSLARVSNPRQRGQIYRCQRTFQASGECQPMIWGGLSSSRWRLLHCPDLGQLQWDLPCMATLSLQPQSRHPWIPMHWGQNVLHPPTLVHTEGKFC